MRTTLGLMLAFVVFQDPGNVPPELIEKKVEQLVARLVSPNKAPPIRGQIPKYAPDYDKSAQTSVSKSFLELQRLGRPALPYLVPHFGDDRYSLTFDTGATYDNFSVGSLCIDILQGHLEPYGWCTAGPPEGDDCRSREQRPSYFWHHRLNEAVEAKKWLESRKDKSMVELQLEVALWVIEEEAKTPDEFHDEERKFMAGIVRKLKNSGKPLPPTVPWSK